MRRFISFASWATGFAVMGAEVAAGRLLAPAFGTSTLVWSALIGVVLGGLALGSRLGGRWSRSDFALRRAFIATAAAGVVLAALPAVARPLMRSSLENFLGGHLVQLALAFGAVLLILVVPVVMLGATSPILVHHATQDRADVGHTAGRLGALATTGSLAGTFLCGVVLVPLVGTEVTFRVCGGLAMFVGVLGLTSLRPRLAGSGRRAARTAIIAVTTVSVVAVIPATRATRGRPALVERETAYAFARVVEDDTYRTLSLNEGYAAQTIARRDGRAYLRGVWGYYAIAPAFAKRPPSRILVLGLGGGASARDYRQRYPDAEVVAVELDEGIVRIAREQFGLPPGVEVHVEDARTFLARDRRRHDLIVVDAFQFPYVPFQLTTREFFEDVRGHLTEGGAVMLNVGRKADQLDVVHAVASTLSTVFPHVNGVNVLHTTSSILVGTMHPLVEAGRDANLRFSAEERWELAELAPVRPWLVPEGARLVLTDDRAPIEWLTHRIVLREILQMAMPKRATAPTKVRS